MARSITYREALNEALTQEMERDETVIVMGEDNAGGEGAPGEQDAWGGVLGVTKDEARAAPLFLRACDANPASGGCLQLANLYAAGHGVPMDKGRALALAKRTCGAPKPVAAACSMGRKRTLPDCTNCSMDGSPIARTRKIASARPLRNASVAASSFAPKKRKSAW